MEDKGHTRDSKTLAKRGHDDSFVLEKSIFSNIFDKDIRRIYIYKKAERLARALHLITPAFSKSDTLKTRIDELTLGLIDGAVLPIREAKNQLSRELLSLSSLLSLARTSGLLSAMNADLIAHESQTLLEEIASYEEPRLALESAPSLAGLSKDVARVAPVARGQARKPASVRSAQHADVLDKGHISDKPARSSRREAIVSVLENRGASYIKDISGIVRDVGEKTIQRELQALVAEGLVKKEGDRRWTRYSMLASVIHEASRA